MNSDGFFCSAVGLSLLVEGKLLVELIGVLEVPLTLDFLLSSDFSGDLTPLLPFLPPSTLLDSSSLLLALPLPVCLNSSFPESFFDDLRRLRAGRVCGAATLNLSELFTETLVIFSICSDSLSENVIFTGLSPSDVCRYSRPFRNCENNNLKLI